MKTALLAPLLLLSCLRPFDASAQNRPRSREERRQRWQHSADKVQLPAELKEKCISDLSVDRKDSERTDFELTSGDRVIDGYWRNGKLYFGSYQFADGSVYRGWFENGRRSRRPQERRHRPLSRPSARGLRPGCHQV